MNPLAKELNEVLEGTLVSQVLSDYGQRMYFPKGIISQSAEAKEKAHLYNATIGIATDKGKAMGINPMYKGFDSSFTYDDLFPMLQQQEI